MNKSVKFSKNLLTIFLTISLVFPTAALFAQVTYQDAFPNISFTRPIELNRPDDGTNRMFVVEQAGIIKVFPVSENVVTSEVDVFLNITAKVQYSNGQELGLLGLAFHPNYTNNGYFYVYYTTSSPVSGISTRMVLSRFKVSSNNSNQADNSSEQIIFQVDKNQNNSNHNGGKIAFGPDGYLYISFGDGGGGNDPQGNGQNINTVFGSICRIDIDVDGSNPVETNVDLPNGNYEIPSDNPLVGNPGLDEIYAYGIRNTWKFSFDNATGRLWASDVGQSAFEEVNLIENGQNYGWSRFEGTSVANSNVIINEPTTFPIYFYNRSQGDISITGGYVYRGSGISSTNPDIHANYIFGDYVSGRVWALDYNPISGVATRTFLFKTNGQLISSFGVDRAGEMYFSSYGNNVRLYKLVDGVGSPTGTAVNGVGQWAPLNEGIQNGVVHAITSGSNNQIYMGGAFSQAGSIAANNIASWNQNSGWAAFGSGTNGTVNALKVDATGKLYAAGNFSQINGVAVNNIGVFDGTQWLAIGSGIEGVITSLAIDNQNHVYVGGIFENLNGVEARNIAKWNGAQWSVLTDASTGNSGTNNEIRALEIDDDGILYVGGNFDEAGGKTANRIATWNGTTWGTLGSGTSGFVEAIATSGTDIYAAGSFVEAGGQTVNRIAKYDKALQTWSALGYGVNNRVSGLRYDGTYLYAGGSFDIAFNTSSDGIIVNNIARWSPANQWQALGTNTSVGVDNQVNALEFGGNSSPALFAGGNFNQAGANSAKNVAFWVDSALGIEDNLAKNELVAYPNPTKEMLTLSKETDWILYDVLGKVLLKGQGKDINLINVSKGIYYLKLNGYIAKKIIKE